MLAMLSATMAARMAMFKVNSPEGCSRLAGGLGGRMTIRRTLRGESLHCAPGIFGAPLAPCGMSTHRTAGASVTWRAVTVWADCSSDRLGRLHASCFRRLAVPRLPRPPTRGTGRLPPSLRTPIDPRRLRPKRRVLGRGRAAPAVPQHHRPRKGDGGGDVLHVGAAGSGGGAAPAR